MQPIKSFLYLDEYKMYSISSQLFGGLTEYLIDYQGKAEEEEERQTGPFGSGRVMADILRSESMTQEKKYLHDYSYTLFERHLKEQNHVHSVSMNTTIIQCIDQVGFVEVRAKTVFNDMDAIKGMIEEYNQLGEALTYITHHDEIKELKQQIDSLQESTRDRNRKAQLRNRLKSLGRIENLAKSKGLHQDPEFLKQLGFLLNYGFQDQFEVRMAAGEYTFSANLKREHLREDEHMLMRNSLDSLRNSSSYSAPLRKRQLVTLMPSTTRRVPRMTNPNISNKQSWQWLKPSPT